MSARGVYCRDCLGKLICELLKLNQHGFWYPPSSVAMTVMLCQGVSSRSRSWVVLMTPLMDSISKYTSLSSLRSMKYLNIEERAWILHEPFRLSPLYIMAVALRAKTAGMGMIIQTLVLLYMTGSWNPANFMCGETYGRTFRLHKLSLKGHIFNFISTPFNFIDQKLIPQYEFIVHKQI